MYVAKFDHSFPLNKHETNIESQPTGTDGCGGGLRLGKLALASGRLSLTLALVNPSHAASFLLLRDMPAADLLSIPPGLNRIRGPGRTSMPH